MAASPHNHDGFPTLTTATTTLPDSIPTVAAAAWQTSPTSDLDGTGVAAFGPVRAPVLPLIDLSRIRVSKIIYRQFKFGTYAMVVRQCGDIDFFFVQMFVRIAVNFI